MNYIVTMSCTLVHELVTMSYTLVHELVTMSCTFALFIEVASDNIVTSVAISSGTDSVEDVQPIKRTMAPTALPPNEYLHNPLLSIY